MQKIIIRCGGLNEIFRVIEKKQKPVIDFLNAYSVFLFKKNKNFRESITDYYYNFPDGISISILYFLKYRKFLKRVPGPSFTEFFLKQKFAKNKKHFFLGLDKKNLIVVAKKFRLPASNLYCYNPPYIKSDIFSKKERERISKLINKSKADYLWVGLGNPKKEILITQIYKKINIKVIFLVGAALDFISGVKKRAPKLLCNLGLEWLYRLVTDFRYVKTKVKGSFKALFFLKNFVEFK
ncbi:MAG: WecB/TagA/CpsF family glycosyltransferase [Candidatus Pacearchaeota archaeon]